MDWEKPRKIASEDKEEAVVAWRSTFIANEVNEIQSHQRKISPETTLIWFLFFWVGIGWENYSQTNPDFIILGSENQPYNLLLKFFLIAFVMLCIVAVEYIFFIIFNLADAPHVQRFTDLCSVSNISILIM
jgi:meckelin